MNIFVRSALALALVAAAPAAGWAQEITLRLATLSPPESAIVTRALQPWAERVNAAGKGVIQIEVVNGATLANFGNAYDRVLADVVQISWGIPTYIGGKFPRSDVTTLPFQSSANSAAKAVALYRLYESGLLKAEYDEIVPLGFSTFPEFGFHFAEKPASITDLSGLKVNVAGAVPAKMVAAMGGAPTSLALHENYEALQRDTVDATTLSWTSFPQFKLAEVTSYHVEAPFGNNNAMVFMSRAKFDSLPEEAQRILLENSGESLSRAFGTFWDAVWMEARNAVEDADGHTIVSLTPDERQVWVDTTAPIVAEWVSKTPDGQAVLDQYLAVIGEELGYR